MLRLSASRLLCLAAILPAIAFGLTPSSVTLTASPNPANYGQAVTLTATVTSGTTGAVTFYDGVTVLGVGTITGTQATLTTVMLPSGTRQLRAYYGGDATYAASSSTVLPQTVVAGTSMGFRHPVSFSPATHTVPMAVGDFNGDGRQDFVAAGATGVSVFLGDGDGTFQPGVYYSTPSAVNSVAVGDFNGDGKMDLTVANYNASSVSVLLGNGDGTFQAAVNYPVAQYPYGVAVGDFNADGKADLVIASATANNVNVLLGNGDGTFSAAVSYSTSVAAYSVAVGDFNGDGKTDIVASTYTGVSVLLGNGNGTFAAAVNYPIGTTSNTVAVADFNGDGKADLAVSNTYYGLVVMLGNGDGTFGTPVSYIAGTPVYGVVVADFDGDGKADLAATNYYYNTVSVLLGNGDGTFKAAVNYPAGQSTATVVVGDFNGDGKADLLVTATTGAGFSVLLGGAIPDLAITVTHSGGFTQGQVGAAYTITVTNVGDVASSGPMGVVVTLPVGLIATSLGGNGWTCDLASLACVRSDSLAPGASNMITFRVNVASGLTGNVTSTFTVSGGGDQNYANNYAADTTFVRYFTGTTLSSSPNPAVLGHAVTLTATVTTGATGTVTFYDGTSFLGSATIAGGQAVFTTYLLPSGARSLHAQYAGDSTYGPSISATRAQTVIAVAANGMSPSVSYATGAGPNWIGVGDVNGDGKADLLTTNNSSSPGVSVLLGNGDGTFRAPVNYTTGSSPNSAVVGDFNGDGKADVAVATCSGIYLLPGNGAGTFQTAALVSPSTCYTSLRSADFNGDGKQDLLAMGGGAVIFLGNGDGTFQPPVAVSTSVNYTSVIVADMNADGKADLVTDAVSVMLGNGDGTFQAPISTTTAAGNPGVGGFAVGDFNGDGKPDVAVLYWVGVKVLLGNGDGSLGPPIQSTVNLVPGYFAMAGDFNGDGKLDVAYAGYYTNQVYLAFGNGDGTFQSGASFVTDSYSCTMVQGDFNSDGKPDFAVANYNTGTVNVFLGAQFSGLSIAVTHTGNFTAGQTGAYQIAIQNFAFASIGGTVTVTDTLPAGLTATAISGGYGWTCTLSTLSCTFPGPVSNNYNFPAITITVNVSGSLSPSTITNHASVSNGGVVNTAADATTIVLPTTTALVAAPNPSSLGQTVTMTAIVTPGAAGTVLFSDGATPLGAAVLAGGQATFSTRLLQAGQRSLAASYAGDATHASSTSAVRVQTVNASQASGFATGGTLTTGSGPWAIVTADFNRDGKTDLVTANSTANTVSVLLGNGNGTFGASTDLSVGTKPVALVVGDFNNDGKPDIAVANQTSNNVSILLGNGDGTFLPAVNYATGSGPVSLAVGDLNGDGIADLVVGNASGQTLTLLFANGDGTFHSAATAFSVYSVSVVAIGDFNRDGKADIAYLSGGYNIYVLLGNGDGTFQPSLYASANSSYAMAVGDLNADGKPDIVVTDPSGVDVLLGNGDGTFKPYVHYAAGAQAPAVLFADVNGDGKLDVVAANSANNTISILLGNGDGTLQPAIAYAVGSSPQGAVAGDFNGDGRTDLAVANSSSNNVSILLGVLTPILSVTSSHAAFGPGQIGAVYTITVINNGPGATSGMVTVTDTLPAGLSATAITGIGWSCTLATLTCTRSETLAAGASYPVITLTVNVTLNSPASVTNQVSVSGGGAIGASAIDPTTVAFASLRIAKSHLGNFAPGIAGVAYTVTVSNATGAGPTNSTVTVTESVPTGMTLVSMSGTGWTCPGTAANNCTRSDALNGGTSYPAIAVTVNVAANATSPQVNSVGVSGGGSATATATDSTTIAIAGSALRFVPMTPCRVADTRNPTGAFGGPAIADNSSRDFNIPSSACGVPATAQAYSLNVTVVPASPLSYLTVWPSGRPQPLVSTLNSWDGRIKSNAVIVPAGTAGAVSVFATNTTHLVLDINGYFVSAADPTALTFYPITPCRIADTRLSAGPLGGPSLGMGQSRTVPMLSSACHLPATAQAYSVNFTAVPGGALGYLAAWPTGHAQPLASSLNAPTGAVTANAAIVPAGTNGSIDVFASNPTDLVIDIDGYFAPMGTGGLSLYGVTPCRVVDTRQPAGSAAITSLDVAVSASACGIPAAAQAHVVNVTVVPPAPFGFLTLWPQGQTRPFVSTLNAGDGAVTSNMAIVPASNGWISAFASNPTHLIADISGYFGQ